MGVLSSVIFGARHTEFTLFLFSFSIGQPDI